MLDIDHFKNVNDTYGHECGDKVLVRVSQELKKTLRAQDLPTRWGGEEFICLLPETDVDGARHVAEKIRTAIEAHCYECRGVSVSVTVTLGISIYDGSCSLEECIRRADDALYKGKKQGRNQVVVTD